MPAPSGLFESYHEIINETFDWFGVDCLLVYKELEEIDQEYNNTPENKSINPRRRPSNTHRRHNKTYREVETTKTVNMKVYFTEKEFVFPGGNIVIPKGSLHTCMKAADVDSVVRADEVIVHEGIQSNSDIRFKRLTKPFPHGFEKDAYYNCYWGINEGS